MNGNTGIQPTVELATTNGNGFYPYPMFPVYGNNNGYGNGFFGDSGILGLLLFAMIFSNGGWGGFGGGNGWNNVATTDYVSSEFTQRDVTNGTQAILTSLSNGFSDQATNTCNLRSDVLTGNMGLQNNILSSSNSIQRDILTQTNELNTNLLTTQLNSQAQLEKCCCDIKELIRANGDETRALITQNTIQDLRDRLTQAQDVISDERTANNVINSLRPYPIPAYLTSSPFVGYGYGFNNGFYGNGFFGNTIV